MKIVVDAMGGDHAPEVVIDGVLSALKEYPVEIVLIGDGSRVLSLLKKHKYDADRLVFAHASEVIEMHESAAISVRRKRDSSIVLGLKMVKEGKAQGFFSAGNTGAVVCDGQSRKGKAGRCHSLCRKYRGSGMCCYIRFGPFTGS